MSNKCPKCGAKLKPTYLKQTCPKCNINLLYYKLDEQLEQDAKNAANEVAKVNHFIDILKSSTIATPWHIIRLILFFTPLASMCLPMYWAGHKNVSLITFIMSIINHGFDLGAIASDKSYLFAVLAVVFVIILSLAEIINSLFSATKRGFRRNIIFSIINTAVFGALSILVCTNGGYVKAGFFTTIAIYAVEFVLHYVTAKPKTNKRKAAAVISIIFCAALLVASSIMPKSTNTSYDVELNKADISVVNFNVASAFGTGIEDTDSLTRCNRFADYMNYISPDFIGTQEMNSYWLDSLNTSLDKYESYGVKRGGDSEEKNSEMNAIFWLKDKYTAVETNTFWLSDTPDVESKYTYTDADGNEAEAGCNRICSYAVLKSSTGDLYLFMNTHLDNSSEEARTFGANVILNELDELKAKYSNVKVVLTGDFNETEQDDTVQMLSSVLNEKSALGATYQDWGYTSTGDMPIDFVFTSGKPIETQILDDINAGYVSDHYGILSEINFNGE